MTTDPPLVKLQGIRGIIAQKMHESLQKTAQLSFFCDVDASALVAARSTLKDSGVKVGFEDLIIRAIIGVLKDFPLFNAVETADGVQPLGQINMGCAIALPGALVAPAIMDCANLSVAEISERRTAMVERAKANKLSIEELTSGTITVTNLGLTRVQHFSPILSYPQQAIIGLGQIGKRPWVAEDGETIVARPVMGLSLTVDHRIIDGAPAGEFLTALANALESVAA